MPYLYVETAGYHLCKGNRLILGGLCNNSGVPNGLKSGPQSNTIPGRTVKVIFPEQSTDAIIYVTVVIVLYAAIILLLIGSNLKRFRGSVASREAPIIQKETIIICDGKNSSALISESKTTEETLNPAKRTDVSVV